MSIGSMTVGETGLSVRTKINAIISKTNNVFISVNDYGAVGDGETDDYSAIQNAIDAAVLARIPLRFPNEKYYLSQGVTISSDIQIQGNNTTLLTDFINGNLLAVSGSIGDYKAISNDITAGQNWIVSPLLAPLVSPGDIIKIYSDQPFNTSLYNYNEATGRGEMVIVRNVVGDYIYTNAIEDNYSNANWDHGILTDQASNLGAALVSAIKVSIDGITLKNTTTDYDLWTEPESRINTSGYSFYYVRDSIINIDVQNFASYGATGVHCFNTEFNAKIINTPRNSGNTGDGSPGYGFQLVGTSMGCVVNGNVENARHCFVYNGSDGVGWNNIVKGIYKSAARSNPIIDTHSPNGRIIFEDMVLVGGDKTIRVETSLEVGYDPETETEFAKSAGIAVGARHVTIKNIKAYNIEHLVSLRMQHEVDHLIIDGITAIGCRRGLVFYGATSGDGAYVKGVEINNVRMEDGTLLYMTDGAPITQKRIIARNCKFKSGLWRHYGGTTLKQLIFESCEIDLSGDSLAFANLDIVKFKNCYLINGTNTPAVDLLNVTNLFVEGNDLSDFTDDAFKFTDAAGTAGSIVTVATNIVIKDNRTESMDTTSLGLVVLPDYSKVTNLMADVNILMADSVNYFLGGTVGVTADNEFVDNNITHAAFVSNVYVP